MNKKEYFQTIIEKLEKLQLEGFEGFSIASLLYVPTRLYLTENIGKKSKLKIIQPFLFDINDFSIVNSKSDVMIYFSYRYNKRIDMHEIFNSMMKCLDGDCAIEGFRKFKLRLDYLKNIIYIYKWKRDLRKVGINKDIIKFYIPYLAKGMNFISFLHRNLNVLQNKKVMVTIFDQDYDEYLITEFCKKMCIKTATIQHGQFMGKTNLQSIEAIPFPYCNLNADYFLAWGNCSKDRAIECGVMPDKIFITGNPKYMYSENKFIPKSLEINSILIFLDGGKNDFSRNCHLLDIMKSVSSNNGIRCSIKLHPNADEQIKMKVHEFGCFEVVNSTEKIKELAQKYDAFVCSKSTVYSELLYLNCVTFRYVENDENDLLYPYTENMDFRDYEGLYSSMDYYNHNPEEYMNILKKLSQYINGSGDIKNNFSEAIDRLKR